MGEWSWRSLAGCQTSSCGWPDGQSALSDPGSSIGVGYWGRIHYPWTGQSAYIRVSTRGWGGRACWREPQCMDGSGKGRTEGAGGRTLLVTGQLVVFGGLIV